jgi:hypothetical protein
VLAAHSLGDFHAARYDAFVRTWAPADRDPWREIGRRYLDLCTESVGAKGRFTDKLLSNYLRVRAIKLALPQAAIISVERDPLDVAWSCWRSQFDGESPWACSADGIALYLSCYRRAMRAWAKRFPGAINAVSYEALVQAPDSVIPSMLTACGLCDHPATRQPEQSKRAVETLSFAEVRKPIHTGSVHGAASFPDATRGLREALERAGLEV